MTKNTLPSMFPKSLYLTGVGVFLFVFVILFIPSVSNAASRYWVGTSGGSTATTTSWSTTSGNACGVSGGASVPVSTDIATFNSDCTNNATIDTNLDVAGIDINTGYTGTITQSNGITVTVGSSNYDQAAGTFTGGDSAIDINDGNFTLSSGTFTNSSGNITVERNFTISGGTFTNTSKTVTFDSDTNADDTTVTCSGTLGGTIVISKATDGANFILDTGCTISLGASPTSSIDGDITNNGTITISSGTWTVQDNGTLTNNATITHSGNGWDMNDSSFTNASGATTTYSGTAITAEQSFTQSGTFDLSGITITFDGADGTDDATLTCGVPLEGNAVINKTNVGGTFILGSSCTIQGDFTRTDGVVSNPASAYTLTVQGDFSMSTADAFGGANLTLAMKGGSDQTITHNAGTFSSPFQVNKTGGTASLSTSFTITTEACDIVEGTFDTNGQAFTCGGTFTVQDGGTLELFGSESLTSATLDSGSTVIYTGDGDSATDNYTIKDYAYHHLTIASTDSGDTYATPSTTEDANGAFTVTGGTFTAPSGNFTIAGNLALTGGTFTHNSGTIVLDGTVQTISGSTTFNNLSKTVSSADTLTFIAGTTQTIAGTATFKGAASNLLSLRSSDAGNQWSFDPQGTRTIEFLDVRDSKNTNATKITIANLNITDSGNNTGWSFPPSGGGPNPQVFSLPPTESLSLTTTDTTTSQSITLNLTAADNVTHILVSNTPDFTNSLAQPYQSTITWNLCEGIQDCSEGEHTIYATFLTKYNVPSEVLTTTLNYDSTGKIPANQPVKEDEGGISEDQTSKAPLKDDEELIIELKERILELQLFFDALTQQLQQITQFPSAVFTKSLYLRLQDPDVKLLQQTLNQQGFTVSSSGSGSPGQETSYFGSLTLKAVQQYQLHHSIVTTTSDPGYGYVGPKTREKLNSLAF